MSADIRVVSTWLRLLAQHAEAGAAIDPRELRWCADALDGTLPPIHIHPVRPWWRRLFRRRLRLTPARRPA
jgi:hypothetical protein